MLIPLLSVLVGSFVLSAPDPCALVTSAEIASALGSQPSAAQREGPAKDEQLNGTSSSCIRQIGRRLFRIDVVEFGNAAGAAKAMDLVLTSSRSDPEGTQLSVESGLGEQALWGGDDEFGALWSARKGRYMVTVSLAGEGGGHLARKGSLKQLASLAVGRVGS